MNGQGGAAEEFRRKFLISFYVFAGILISGTAGYYVISGGQSSLMDCLYMTVISVTTVGYGEIVDISKSTAGRVFTMVLIFAGMGTILSFVSNVTAFLIEGSLKQLFWRKKMQKLIDSMNGHYIVCGAGTIGVHIVNELLETRRQVVVIDYSEEKVNQLKDRFSAAAFLSGDATESELLKHAGIERAGGLFASTANDKDNLVIAITARQANPGIRIVSRCNDISHTEKLKRAGANSVVSSNFIGGLRMASEMVRPEVASFLDIMLRDKDKALRIEGIKVPKGSAISGKPASDIKRHCLLLALQREDGSYEFNPSDSLNIEFGMTVIFMGSPEVRAELERLINV